MAKEKPEITYELDDIVDVIKESDVHDWVKAVLRISWNGNPSTLDIRSMNMKTKRIGKGISLSNEEADRLVAILLENDFGSLADLESAIKRKKDFFTITKTIDYKLNKDGYHIDIEV